MAASETCLFLPGFAASPRVYASVLPSGWEAPRPPTLRATHGSLAVLRDWVVDELRRRPGPAVVAGHSMGAALAVLAAVAVPDRIARLLLVSPAGLPIRKPVRKSVADLFRQVLAETYALEDIARSSRDLLSAPRATTRLIRSLRALDLTPQMRRVRREGIPASVVACTTDTLVTPEACRRTANLLGGDYREVGSAGGHVWMLSRPEVLASLLTESAQVGGARP